MMKSIEARRSIRKYLDKPVEEEKIMQLIESARLAPSGHNYQPWHFIIVQSEENKKEIAEVSHKQKWMCSAPAYIVCVADICSVKDYDEEIYLDENSPQGALKRIIRDTAIAIEHIISYETWKGTKTMDEEVYE